MSYPTLRTRRLILRPWREEDLAPFSSLNADPRVMEYMLRPLSRQESDAFAARIAAGFEEHGYGLWAAELPGVAPFIGFIGLQWPNFETPFRRAPEIGFRLAAAHWRRGYATEGGRAVLRHAFEAADLREVISFTSCLNLPSQRVILRLGLIRDPEGDFNHPRVPEGRRLRPHFLYRMRGEEWVRIREATQDLL